MRFLRAGARYVCEIPWKLWGQESSPPLRGAAAGPCKGETCSVGQWGCLAKNSHGVVRRSIPRDRRLETPNAA